MTLESGVDVFGRGKLPIEQPQRIQVLLRSCAGGLGGSMLQCVWWRTFLHMTPMPDEGLKGDIPQPFAVHVLNFIDRQVLRQWVLILAFGQTQETMSTDSTRIDPAYCDIHHEVRASLRAPVPWPLPPQFTRVLDCVWTSICVPAMFE